MKKLLFILAAIFLGTSATYAATAESKVDNINLFNQNSFIFVENGVTFSVFPDGEFDFYVDNRLNINAGNRNGNLGITFNSGFNYNPFVQFDDFGAIIQVENVPVFYDFYGRVNQIGGVNINFNNGFVNRIGGMNIFYNRGRFSHFNGFINRYNRRYVYRPFHRWFARPAIGFCNVWTSPYRQFYSPIRYTWHRPYRNNVRRAYAQIGREHRYNRVRRERSNVYRNDRRVAVRDNASRSNRNVVKRSNSNRNNGVAKRANGLRSNRTVASNSSTRSNRNSIATNRGSAVKRSSANTLRGSNRNVAKRSNTTRNSVATNRGSAVKRSSANTSRGYNRAVSRNQGRTVTKRAVTRTPRSTDVSRSSTTYRKPVQRTANTRTNKARTQRSVSSRKVTKAPTRTTVSRSTNSRTIRKAPARSMARSATVRSSRRQ